jgi:hypothetical protein
MVWRMASAVLVQVNGFWVGIMGLDEGGDGGLEFVDAAMDAALDLLAGE